MAELRWHSMATRGLPSLFCGLILQGLWPHTPVLPNVFLQDTERDHLSRPAETEPGMGRLSGSWYVTLSGMGTGLEKYSPKVQRPR